MASEIETLKIDLEYWPDGAWNADPTEGREPGSREREADRAADAAGIRWRSIYELETGWDSSRRTIYVESHKADTCRPFVWCRVHRIGNAHRFKRGVHGIRGLNLKQGTVFSSTD